MDDVVHVNFLIIAAAEEDLADTSLPLFGLEKFQRSPDRPGI